MFEFFFWHWTTCKPWGIYYYILDHTILISNAVSQWPVKYKSSQNNEFQPIQVMWSITGTTGETSNESCRLCKARPVELVCQNKYHKDAYCKKCAKKVRSAIMGAPGPHASTHIYDFRVRKVDFEGMTFSCSWGLLMGWGAIKLKIKKPSKFINFCLFFHQN